MSVEPKVRQLQGPLKILVKVLLIGIPVTGILYISDVPSLFGKSVYLQQYLGVFLAFTLCPIFLTVPPVRKATRDRVPFYDAICAVLSLVVGGYVAVFYPRLLARLGFISPVNLILGAIALILIIEATRRILGWPLVILGILFILYPFFSYLLPGILHTRQLLWSRVLTNFYIAPSSLFGIPLIIAATMVLSFIFFGHCLFTVGGGQFLTDLAMSLMGRYRGGPAKIAIIASSLFGTMSGSASANVAATGTITIPLMKRIGYRPDFAAAVEAVASTGGCITPPVMAAAAFLIAEFLEISYYEVAKAAIIPAILYYTAVFAQVDLEAVRRRLKGLPPEELPPFGSVFRRGAVFVVPLLVLVYCLFFLFLDPSVAALYAVAATFLVSLFKRESRSGIKRILHILEGTGRSLLEIGVISMVAGFIVGSISMTGLGVSLSKMLISLSGGNTFILLIVSALCCIILGMGMPVTAIYIVVITLIGPALINVGIEPLAAHLFICYFGVLSFITPPVCTATYVAAGIAGSEPLRTAFVGIRLGIAAYIAPFIFAFAPAILLMGSWTDIAVTVPSAIIGIVMIAAALEGYFVQRLNAPERIWAAIGGLGLIMPGHKWAVLGLGLSVALFLYQRLKRKSALSLDEEE